MNYSLTKTFHLDTLKHCLNMIVFSSSPQALNTNKNRLLSLIGLALSIALLARYQQPNITATLAIIDTLAEYGFLMISVFAAVGFFGQKDKFIMLATAIVGISLIGDSLFVVVRTLFNNEQAMLFAVSIILVQILGFTYALKKSMDLRIQTAIFLTFLYIVGVMAFLGMVNDAVMFISTS